MIQALLAGFVVFVIGVIATGSGNQKAEYTRGYGEGFSEAVKEARILYEVQGLTFNGNEVECKHK